MATTGRSVACLLVVLAAASCAGPGTPRAAPPNGGTPATAGATTATAGAAGTAGTPGPTTTTVLSPAATGPTTTIPGSVLPTPGDPGTWTIGSWVPAGRPVAGSPAVETNGLRHSPGGATIAVARMDTARLRAAFYPGSGPGQSAVPSNLWPAVVATFNSGFKMNQSRGGWYLNGATPVPLRDGAASLVIFADGSATVGQWGRDVRMAANVVAVRQNLVLMVDGGRPVPGLTGPSSSLQAGWGYTLGGGIATWRSAVGVDTSGRLLYVAGPALDPVTLAWGLAAAGATRAMELDINPAWPSFSTFVDGPAGPASPVGTKLLPGMSGSPDHFLRGAGGRDFFAVFARS